MRKFGDLLKDLGFNPDASLDVQKAFVRHLVKQADKSAPIPPKVESKPTMTDAQLSFDSDILGVASHEARFPKRKSR